MKKQIFLVSALVAIAMSSMFVACADKNQPSNDSDSDSIDGCSCTLVYDGEKETYSFSLSEMKEIYDVRTCERLAKLLLEEGWDRVTCTGYSLN